MLRVGDIGRANWKMLGSDKSTCDRLILHEGSVEGAEDLLAKMQYHSRVLQTDLVFELKTG